MALEQQSRNAQIFHSNLTGKDYQVPLWYNTSNPMPQYLSQAQAQDDALYAQQQQLAATQQQTVAAQQQQATQQAATQAQRQQASDTGYNDYLDTARSRLSSKGLDPNAFMDQVLSSANPVHAAVGTYYDPSLIDSILNTEQSKRVTGYTNQFNALTPSGFENTLLPDTALTPLVDSILGPQYNDSKTYLDNAQKRGMLDDIGYTNALGRLDSDRGIASGTLNDQGKNILDTDRRGLTSAANTDRGIIGGYTLGSTAPDVTKMYSDINNSAQTDLSSLGSALSAASGGTQYFNPSSYYNVSGDGAQQVGSSDPSSIAATLASRRRAADDAKRGVGTTGAF